MAGEEIDAVFENGVFRPLSPVRLPEHQRVTLVLPGNQVAATEQGDATVGYEPLPLEGPLPIETPVAGWHYLVRRRHPWRQQLYVIGRNMTARQLFGSMKVNQLDEVKTAADFHLPVEVIREALVYVEANQDLLETEAEIERLMLKRGGVARAPQPVSR